ncbi:MAG: hypothetical protein H0X58_07855 [Acidimicrobiia bacterium]|nr:hypothetical protein [Acidimicrobiia bacterium]
MAPNPVIAGLTIATGVAWPGLEAWNHREEIAEVWNDGVEAAVGDFAGGAVDGGKKVVSALKPFD